MANLLSMPSMTIGLMGSRPRQSNSLLDLLAKAQKDAEQAQFDAGDAYFTNPQSRPAGNGVPVLENGSVGYVAPTQGAAPAQRERVSALNVLFRGLAPNLSGALDSERARLQAQAEAPARNARIQDVLAGIEDPRERALFLGLGGEDWQKNVGQQYAPQVIAPGAIQAIGGRAAVGAPQQYDQGDQRRSFDPVTRQDILVNERGPTIAEQTAQNRLAWDQQYGAGQLGISAQNADTSRISALRPQIANTGQGGITSLINADGTVGQQIQGRTQRPAAAIDTENRITALQTDVTPTLGRMRSLLTSGDVITGYAADTRLDAARALAGLGNEKAKKEVAATEEYRNTAARLRVGMAKSLGANPSNADLAILEQVTGGNINQNQDSLLATITQGEEMTARQMQAAQQQLSQYGGGSAQSGSVAQPTSAAEYQALPSGTLFLAPDGSTRRKP